VASIWATMTAAIARQSGHAIDTSLALKLTSTVVKGSLLYIGGTKVLNWFLNAVPVVGTAGAVSANAALNYIYTINLGAFLSHELSRPDADARELLNQFYSDPTGLAELRAMVFRKPTKEELLEATNELSRSSSSNGHESLLSPDRRFRSMIILLDDGDSSLRANLAEQDTQPVVQSDVAYLRFPPGHPTSRLLYVRNPVDPACYYPAGSFHHYVFEHKLLELLGLLSSLGATRIAVECAQGWLIEHPADAEESCQSVVLDGSIQASMRSISRSQWEIDLPGRLSDKPPGDLRWYEREPNWQHVADMRMQQGLSSFHTVLSYTDDFGVNRDITAAIEEIGVSLGGEFHDKRDTIWLMSGDFPALDTGPHPKGGRAKAKSKGKGKRKR
jgi:hypothetical protein